MQIPRKLADSTMVPSSTAMLPAAVSAVRARLFAFCFLQCVCSTTLWTAPCCFCSTGAAPRLVSPANDRSAGDGAHSRLRSERQAMLNSIQVARLGLQTPEPLPPFCVTLAMLTDAGSCAGIAPVRAADCAALQVRCRLPSNSVQPAGTRGEFHCGTLLSCLPLPWSNAFCLRAE